MHVPVKVQEGPTLTDAATAEVGSRRPIDSGLYTQLEVDLEEAFLGDESVELVTGALRNTERHSIVHWTVKVFGAYKPAAAVARVEAIVDRSIKSYRRTMRRLRREAEKNSLRALRAEARGMKRDKKRSNHEHQVRPRSRPVLASP